MIRPAQLHLLSLALTLCTLPTSAPAQTDKRPPSPAAVLQDDDAAHPADTHGWVETRLFFGLGPFNTAHAAAREAAWSHFLDTEVTPRFPDGLSVLNAYGQWQGKLEHARHQQKPTRIRSKMLLIDYPSTPENAAKIDAIRTAWKRQTGDQSVLKVIQPVDVSF